MPEADKVVGYDEEYLQSQRNEWPVAAMAPLSDVEDLSGRALVLSVAELRELVDPDGKLVILLSNVKSYSEADRVVNDTLKGSLDFLQRRSPGHGDCMTLTDGRAPSLLLVRCISVQCLLSPVLHVNPCRGCDEGQGLTPSA